jgi:predicted regulator of Ras-like GTPase activity (Roadblock/LC7/MglB family)
MFQESLVKIVENCEGAVAAVIMGFDGIALDKVVRDRTLDVQTISTEFSFVLTQARKAAEILRIGALEEVSIRSETLSFIIKILNEDYFLGLALLPNGNSGKGRFLMRLATPELRSKLCA